MAKNPDTKGLWGPRKGNRERLKQASNEMETLSKIRKKSGRGGSRVEKSNWSKNTTPWEKKKKKKKFPSVLRCTTPISRGYTGCTKGGQPGTGPKFGGGGGLGKKAGEVNIVPRTRKKQMPGGEIGTNPGRGGSVPPIKKLWEKKKKKPQGQTATTHLGKACGLERGLPCWGP